MVPATGWRHFLCRRIPHRRTHSGRPVAQHFADVPEHCPTSRGIRKHSLHCIWCICIYAPHAEEALTSCVGRALLPPVGNLMELDHTRRLPRAGAVNSLRALDTAIPRPVHRVGGRGVTQSAPIAKAPTSTRSPVLLLSGHANPFHNWCGSTRSSASPRCLPFPSGTRK